MTWVRTELVVQAVGALFTAAVVVLTLWLFGALAWSAKLIGLYHPALDSPLLTRPVGQGRNRDLIRSAVSIGATDRGVVLPGPVGTRPSSGRKRP